MTRYLLSYLFSSLILKYASLRVMSYLTSWGRRFLSHIAVFQLYLFGSFGSFSLVITDLLFRIPTEMYLTRLVDHV